MQKKHRIFIAINLPSDIKKALANYERKWPELPAKWTTPDNLHVTLLFLGDLTDEELGEVCIAVKEVAENYDSFELILNVIGYGPGDKLPPRYLWAGGEKSMEASALRDELEAVLSEKIHLVLENRAFSPHVTMARINTLEWRQINPEERPEVSQQVEMLFSVESIEVMESELKKGGPVYTTIESMPLKS